MKHLTFEEVIEDLKIIQSQMRDTAEHGVSEELESAIKSLERLSKECNDKNLSAESLLVLSKFFDKLPSFIRLIELLSSGC
jgi:hypothetical protein